MNTTFRCTPVLPSNARQTEKTNKANGAILFGINARKSYSPINV